MTRRDRRSGTDSSIDQPPARAETGRRANGADGRSEQDEQDARNATPSGQSTPTAAQLRRFIKSRPYVPLHELRRRFELNGELDEVNAMTVGDGGPVYVGLPQREAQLLGGLARDGDIGLELSQDPRVPIVVGVYPMRPISRS